MDFPRDLRYTKTHEWVRLVERRCIVGITEYAQRELSDVVYVELPRLDTPVKQGRPCAVVESVKVAFDIYAPVSGKIIAVNKNLETQPALINIDPYGGGWFFEILPSNLEEFESLLDSEKYENLIHQSTH